MKEGDHLILFAIVITLWVLVIVSVPTFKDVERIVKEQCNGN